LYRQLGETQKALEDCTQALQIEQSATSRALTQGIMGRIYSDLGQEQKALELFNQVLPVWREAGIRVGEAATLNNLGRVYSTLGQKQTALEYLNQALPIWREAGNRSGEASTLDNLGRAHSDMGEATAALDYFNQALPLWRAAGERSGEALTLTNMAMAYANLGQKQKAVEFYKQSLVEWREVGERAGEADALNWMGRVYSDLGQKQMALDCYNQALPLWRAAGSRGGEALALNDIGKVYADLGKGKDALNFYNQALPAWREASNRRGEAATLNNIGRAYLDLGDASKALETDYAALSVWKEVQDRRGQAFALSSISRAYFAMDQPQKALPTELAALSLGKDAGDPDLEGGIETALMMGFRSEQHLEEAILFGTDAVNAYQQIRKNISGMDKDLQIGFAQSKSSTYRILAELLVQTGRLGEAEQVLDLLKEQEMKEVVRGATDHPDAKVEPLKLTSLQQTAQGELAAPEKAAEALTDLSVEYARLNAQAKRTPDDDARLKILEAQIEKQNGEVTDFFRKTLYPELAHASGAQDANALLSREKSEVSRLQNTLAELGPRVIGIRLLLAEDHAYAMVVTAQMRKKFELNATPAELRSKVLQVREDLRTPSSDPKPHLAELYTMVVAPFDTELKALEQLPAQAGHVPVLLWSLDGVMRYVPMSALYDGQHFMIERFSNVLFTPESYGHMLDSSTATSAGMRVLAMGLSKSYGGLPALPGVTPELDAVVHDASVAETHGPMDGTLLRNDQFTLAALKQELGAGNGFSVVHIASHFVEETGSDVEPYLMLGGENAGTADGYALTLSKIEDSTISFHGTRLLTLSACSTAKGDAAKDGLEMDSLGMIAQQKDADAVLATLWDVNDASTSRLMSDFYGRWVKHSVDGKAEALRQAQMALLRGPAVSTNAAGDRGFQTAPERAPTAHGAGYAHPYFWAPFVLIGNFH
jgi:CHAT domain-containing protein/Tfp pilus assembly protein PilF